MRGLFGLKIAPQPANRPRRRDTGRDRVYARDPLSIFDKAKARCPTHKKKSWDMVAIASF
jgi:hypothetical protein